MMVWRGDFSWRLIVMDNTYNHIIHRSAIEGQEHILKI